MAWFKRKPKEDKIKFKKKPEKLAEQLAELIMDLMNDNPYIPRRIAEYEFSQPYSQYDAATELASYPGLREALEDLDIKPNYPQAYDASYGHVARPKEMSNRVQVDIIIHLVSDNARIMTTWQQRWEIFEILRHHGQEQRRLYEERVAEEARLEAERQAEAARVAEEAALAAEATSDPADPESTPAP